MHVSCGHIVSAPSSHCSRNTNIVQNSWILMKKTVWGSSCILRKFGMKHLLNKHTQTIPSTLLKTVCGAATLGLHTVDNLQLQWHLMTYSYSLYCYEGSHTYLWAWKWISTACVEPQDFCPVGILRCFYHSRKPYFNCGFCQTSKLQKAFPFANEQRMHVRFYLLCATFYEKAFAPTQVPPTICNWTLKCRRANQLLIHLKLTGRPDYGGSFLLQTPYRHHLYGDMCLHVQTWKRFHVQLANQFFVRCDNKPRANCFLHT